jgi:hypothetical protein
VLPYVSIYCVKKRKKSIAAYECTFHFILRIFITTAKNWTIKKTEIDRFGERITTMCKNAIKKNEMKYVGIAREKITALHEKFLIE